MLDLSFALLPLMLKFFHKIESFQFVVRACSQFANTSTNVTGSKLFKYFFDTLLPGLSWELVEAGLRNR